MNYIDQRKIILLSRDEGKIKSYDSCFDLRAWSHDISVRDRYLREWIKCNMPSYLFPLPVLNNLLKSINCRHFGLNPRCHPECKSKKLLENICASCQAMKECLKNNENLETFFDEEELETGHWPCDKCLSALKSIRMFWKIILDKIFKITIPNTEVISKEHHSSRNGIDNVAKVWQKEILEEATFVKKLIPPITNNRFLCKQIESAKSDTDTSNLQYDKKQSDMNFKSNSSKCVCNCKLAKNKTSEYTTTSIVKLFNTGCDPFNDSYNDKLKSYRNYLKNLQDEFRIQANKVEKLTRENVSLKYKLRELCKKYSRKSFHSQEILSPVCNVNHVLRPFETSSEENIRSDLTKDTNSEVIITVKNCKNENFKHVCMLKLVHKTNAPMEDFTVKKHGSSEKQDPIDLLTNVQKTFGNIVRKELSIANTKRSHGTRKDISATFAKNAHNFFQSTSSCSSMSSC